MDYNKNHMVILALLIINKGDPLNNPYSLLRILEWRFGVVLNTKEILDDIKEKKYAEYEIINVLHYYTLTKTGKNIIQQEFETSYNFLIKNYDKEVEIIKSLFDSFKP